MARNFEFPGMQLRWWGWRHRRWCFGNRSKVWKWYLDAGPITIYKRFSDVDSSHRAVMSDNVDYVK